MSERRELKKLGITFFVFAVIRREFSDCGKPVRSSCTGYTVFLRFYIYGSVFPYAQYSEILPKAVQHL